MENNNIKVGCLSPLTVILFLAFFFAKVFGYIAWSWWWVFAPLWIPALVCLILIILIIIAKIWTGSTW